MRGLGQRAGPLPGCCMLATGCAFSRHGHELTIMEFVKPKPGSVENLFLISGRHLGATAKCVRAGEQRAAHPAQLHGPQHPASLARG